MADGCCSLCLDRLVWWLSLLSQYRRHKIWTASFFLLVDCVRQTHTHTHTRARARARSHAHTRRHIETNTVCCLHTPAPDMHMLAQTCTHTYTNTYTRVYICPYTYTYHAGKHYTLTHIRAHVRAHTYTLAPRALLSWPTIVIVLACRWANTAVLWCNGRDIDVARYASS